MNRIFYRSTITRKVGLLLFFLTIGGFVALGTFYWFLINTKYDTHFINVAGRQRMLSEQLQFYTYLLQTGENEVHKSLLETVEIFDRSVNVLEHGGEIMGKKLPPPPAEILEELTRIKELWNQLKPALISIASEMSSYDPSQISHIISNLPLLTKASHRLVDSYDSRVHVLKERMLHTLLTIAGLNMVFLLGGVVLTKRYIVYPIRSLTAGAERIRNSDFTVQIPVTTMDELKTLTETFNSMSKDIDRLVATLDRQRRHNGNIVASVPAGLLVLTDELLITCSNRVFLNYFNLQRKGTIGKNLIDIIPIPELAREVSDVIKTKKPKYDLHYKLNNKYLRINVSRLENIEEGACVLLAIEDITERKKSEERLKELSAVVEHTADLVFITDENGIIQYVNPAFEKQTGYSEKEIVGKTTPRIFKSGLHDERLYTNLWKTITSGSVFQEVITNRKKNGEFYHEVKTITPIKDSNGNITHFVSIGKDITELKRAEEKLNLLGKALESVANATVITDNEGKIIWINPSFTELTGYTLEEIQGKTPKVVSSGKHDDEFYSEIWDTILSGQVWQGEIINRRKNGELYTEEQIITPVKNEDGEITHFVSVRQDISERKEMEKTLKENREFLEKVIETAPSLIVLARLDSSIVFFNKACEELTGYSRDEVRGKKIIDLFVPDSWKKEVKKRFEDPFSPRLIDSHVNPWIAKEGKEKQIEWRCTILQKSGNEDPYILSTGVDLTERKKLESQLQQAQKMEAIGRLAGGVAHDFNNLLTVILIYSDSLLMKISSDEGLKESVTEIKRAAERASELTGQLLAFGRRQAVHPKLIDINAVIKDSRKMLGHLIREDIELLTELIPGTACIMFDPGQIEQIIINLVLNARDAMDEGGKITISTSKVILDEPYMGRYMEIKPGNYILMTVSDTGHGMAEEILSHIFEPFFTTKKMGTGSGTGLGLASVYGIISQNGGFIDVQSKVGEGTDFKLYIPEVPMDNHYENQKQEIIGTVKHKKQATILFVEDEKAIRQISCEVLVSIGGYKVIEASNGNDALKICKEHEGRIDLMIVDLVMPEMRGDKLAEEALKLRPGVKILYISGYSENVFSGDKVLEPDISFLKKPFTTSDLLEQVSILLQAS